MSDREGAVPRLVSAYTEASPGDTSPAPPEGTPSRGEGLPQTRGERKRTRGGGEVIEAKDLPKEVLEQIRESNKVAYWQEKEARKKMREEAAAKKKQDRDLAEEAAAKKKQDRDLAEVQRSLDQPLTIRGFGAYMQDVERKFMILHDRIEANYVALQNVALDNPKYGDLVTSYVEEFPKAQERIMLWRNTVREIETANFNFVDMREKVTAWNADTKNPRISIHCFPHQWLMEKFSQGNPDATITQDERRAFGIELGFPEEAIDAILQGAFLLQNKPVDKQENTE